MSNRSDPSGTDRPLVTQQEILSRQRSILLHLTQPSKYEEAPDDLLPAGLVGLDLVRLRLVAQLALAKRMRKVEALLPATVHCVARRAPHLVRLFAERYPPSDSTRYVNAMQFHDFLIEVSGSTGSCIPYLEDLVRCEFAVARVGREPRLAEGAPADSLSVPLAGTVRVRARPEVPIVEFRYSVRWLLENPAATPPPTVPESPGRIAVIPAEGAPRTLQIDLGIYELLRSLADWTILTLEPDGDETLAETLRRLRENGLIQVSTCESA